MLRLAGEGEGGELQREDGGGGGGQWSEGLLPAQPELVLPGVGPGAQHHVLPHTVGHQLPGDQPGTLSEVNITQPVPTTPGGTAANREM